MKAAHSVFQPMRSAGIVALMWAGTGMSRPLQTSSEHQYHAVYAGVGYHWSRVTRTLAARPSVSKTLVIRWFDSVATLSGSSHDAPGHTVCLLLLSTSCTPETRYQERSIIASFQDTCCLSKEIMNVHINQEAELTLDQQKNRRKQERAVEHAINDQTPE